MTFAADIKPNEAADSVTGDSLKAKLTTGESDAFVFTWAGGLLFDLTVTAGVTTPATRENAKVYGQSASPTQVRASADMPLSSLLLYSQRRLPLSLSSSSEMVSEPYGVAWVVATLAGGLPEFQTMMNILPCCRSWAGSCRHPPMPSPSMMHCTR